ncbi:hypothetical protein OGW08_08910 [Citrobacter sp. Cf122]|uniref:hypothetical protein n=1 Tax=Citrobacter sp. Cf122 TaxID=2985072 RepID=UPI002578AAD1|nr:hypothetical protein [Citrobacter sp. Cf122]MDM3154230.1 hypothetical protein [Citrobacter sp. Cf122]
MSQLHGVETIELTSGSVAVTTIQTAIIGLVGTAPDASAGSAATVTTGTPILDNVLNFRAKVAGKAGNIIQVDAVAAVPETESPQAVNTSASWDDSERKLTVILGCDEHGVITARPTDVVSVVNVLDGGKVEAEGSGDGLVAPFSVKLEGGEDEPFPLNTPVAVAGTALINRLGDSGTLKVSVVSAPSGRS